MAPRFLPAPCRKGLYFFPINKKPCRKTTGLLHSKLPAAQLGGQRDNLDVLVVLGSLDFELNRTSNGSKQRVVTAHADVVTGVEASAALANNDGTSVDHLAAETLTPMR